MLTCLACSKQLGDAAEPARGNPSTKEAVKSLTSQIKEMVLKLSGGNRQCKPSAGVPFSSSNPHRSHSGGGGLSEDEHLQYLTGWGSSTATMPGWDFAGVNSDSVDARFADGVKWWPPPRIGFQGGEPLSREGASYDVLLEDDDGEPKEWMALVEPGVLITFISLPGGGNDLKRIRFSREMFNKWQAQRWWGDNYDRIMELYNVQRFSRQGLPTPPRSEDERDSSHHSRPGSARESPGALPSPFKHAPARNAARRVPTGGGAAPDGECGAALAPVTDPTERLLQRAASSPVEASRRTTSSRDEDTTEWVEQDDPGVYVTVRQLADGARELRRVKFSRQHFSEVRAKQWWEENWERIQAQYL
ncbi:unnamed protein product [Spirodela intermedia]|uniref:BRX domain-containing protein n=1 Tax=Spirodela intermedia TaxID=51605 RepID=A0A7I8L8W0_SPIIN|nr:unnamed protein product [Spirodela intermedia]